jgi:hypothetical protein
VHFYHAPADGFDDPIPVTCDWNVGFGHCQAVAENKPSTCPDADGFWVGPGRSVSCLYGGEVSIKFTKHGWHKVNDSENMRCVHGLQWPPGRPALRSGSLAMPGKD